MRRTGRGDLGLVAFELDHLPRECPGSCGRRLQVGYRRVVRDEGHVS